MQREGKNTWDKLTRVLFLAGFFFFAHLLTAKSPIEKHSKETIRQQAAEQVFKAQAIRVQAQQQISVSQPLPAPFSSFITNPVSLPVKTGKVYFLHHPYSVPDGFIRFFYCYHLPYSDDPDRN